MRILALTAAALLSLAAGAPAPQKAPEPQNIVFARVWPNAGQVGLFIADADGSGERLLVGPGEIDYDPVWSPDAASIVFTSDRNGSADLYRVKPDGTGLERLTENPAYDDQAAFSPDGKQLVFVTTRAGGTSDLWTMDLQTKKAKALTSGPGGDFRPAWSPDGKWIAFSSDRGSTMPMGTRPLGASAGCRSLHDSPGRHRPEAHDRARQFLRQPEVFRRQHDACSRTAWTPRTRSRPDVPARSPRASTPSAGRWRRVSFRSTSPSCRIDRCAGWTRA